MARRASARPPTRAESPPLTKDDLSTRESLILAQAVFELGVHEWHRVVQILNGHTLIHRPDSAFTPESTEAIWRAMMTDAGVEFSEADLERKKSLPSRRLAHVWHQKRMTELKDQIAAEEARFKTIAAEIVAIKSGAWDDKIKAMLEPESEVAEQQAPEPVATVTSDEPEAPSTRREPEVEPDQDQTEEPVEQTAQAEEPLDADMAIADRQPSADASEPSVAQLDDSKSVKSEQLEDGDVSIPDEHDADDVSPRRSADVDKPNTQPSSAEEDEDEEMRDQKETSPDIPLQQATPVPERRTTRQSKRRASEAASELSESVRDRKKQREASTAAEDSDEDSVTTRRRAQEAAKKFERVIMMLHADISNHRNGAIFQNPIKPSEAPDYHEIVKRPMDLKTMKARIKSGHISTSTDFQRDIYLMFANSMMYNRPSSDIYAMAEEMMMEAEKKIQEFRQTEVLRGG
ncbi:hypothetical protein PENSPDRAFT_647444 [Peniophora sp. CONT]|nr:hypothetical protein PENSPDRAFT_647444 [Peniophora sp. CONT]